MKGGPGNFQLKKLSAAPVHPPAHSIESGRSVSRNYLATRLAELQDREEILMTP